MRRRLALLIFCLGCAPLGVHAQGLVDSIDAATVAEAALQVNDAAAASEALAEWLTERVADPLDLNTASVEDLSRLPGLTPLMAQRIIARRTTRGPYSSHSALLSVEGLDDDVYRAIRPFIAVDSSSAPPHRGSLLRDMEGRFIQRVTRRLDVGRGYDAPDSTRTTYTGPPARLYTRLQLQSARRLHFNLTLEKDPGEAFRWQPDTHTFGFDHVSAHAMVEDLGPLKTLVFGDYSMAFGQGMALWRSFSFSKGRDVIAPAVRHGGGLSSYSSTEENRFFRGLGATVALHPRLSFTAFGSRRRLDATLTTDEQGRQVLASLASGGLHRTANEIAQKDAARETVLGGALAWTQSMFDVGLAGYRSVFDRPLQRGAAPYELFDATGRIHTAVTAYASATLDAIYVFGEVARSEEAWGGTGGVLIDEENADAVVSVRHFPRRFVSLHGQAFGAHGGTPQNESGTYIGLRVRPAEKWTLSGYIDQYTFPWLRFATPRPSTGRDVRFLVEHAPRRWLSYYLQIRSETREEGRRRRTTKGQVVDGLQPITRQSVRVHGDYSFSPRLHFRMRMEGSRHRSDETETGVLLYQGLRWHPTAWLQLDTRWALFDTEGFNARIYAYEHDLLYTFSIPVFSGRGERRYVLFRVKPSRQINVELKYGTTHYRDVTSVGSGLDEVDGQRIREVRAQVRWAF